MTKELQSQESRNVALHQGNGHVQVLPRTDIIEREDSIVVVMDVPGVDEAALNIGIEDQKLSVSAEATEQKTEGMTMRSHEFRRAVYRREFTLSDWVEVDKVDATVRDGVLRITLPKSERSRPRKITVRAAS